MSSTISRKQRLRVMHRDHHRCIWCGWSERLGAPETKTTVDFVVFPRDGGSDADDNIVALCNACRTGRRELYAERGAAFDPNAAVEAAERIAINKSKHEQGPYGYDLDDNDNLVECEEEQKNIKDICDIYRGGDSIRNTAVVMNAWGRKYRGGRPFDFETVGDILKRNGEKLDPTHWWMHYDLKKELQYERQERR